MNSTRSRALMTVVATAALAVGLVGCSTAGSTTPAAPDKPANLAGQWKQNNSKSADAYQAATIKGDTMTINWVTDGGSTKSLYWAGSYTAPTKPGSFTWSSKNDKSQTDGALLASGDATKKFSYADDTISYEVSALGTTATVTLKKK